MRGEERRGWVDSKAGKREREEREGPGKGGREGEEQTERV